MVEQTHEQVSGEPTVPNNESTDAFHGSSSGDGRQRIGPRMMLLRPGEGHQENASRDIDFSSKDHASDKQKDEDEKTLAYVWKHYQDETNSLPGSANELRPITIFSLPSYIRATNEAMHKPKLVSIGPYHHEYYGPLQTLLEHKSWCARDFMNTYELDPKKCIQKIVAMEPRARLCYSEEVGQNRKGFVKMLLLDGCFILEFIRKCHHDNIPDTFFKIERNKATILSDILLMENQIPYFIIHELFNLANAGKSSCSESSCKLHDQIFNLLPPQISWRNPSISCDKIHHLLHFYYLCMKPESKNEGTQYNSKSTEERKPKPHNADELKKFILPNATELTEAGVTFRKRTEPRHLFDISFENGVMEIPVLFIDDFNCILLTNLLAFEQCWYGPNGFISQFVSLFDHLIDSEKDVCLLEESDILLNMTGNDRETAFFFNKLAKWNLVEYGKDYLSLITSVQSFYNSPWPKYRATLVRDYFTNPWTIISLIAAIILLGLTIVQTYYTVYSSIHK